MKFASFKQWVRDVKLLNLLAPVNILAARFWGLYTQLTYILLLVPHTVST